MGKKMTRTILALAFGIRLVAATSVVGDEYYEISADIDGDGIADCVVSEPIRDFGMAGGSWEVFLGKKEGGFVSVGSIFAHPLALRAEKLSDSVRLWVYMRASASSGVLGYYVLKAGRLSDLKKIEISPGDGGTEVGRAIYAAVFSDAECFTVVKKEAQPEC